MRIFSHKKAQKADAVPSSRFQSLETFIPIIGKSEKNIYAGFLTASDRFDQLSSIHPHDVLRTWIRSRVAPRRLRPVGFFLPRTFCGGLA